LREDRAAQIDELINRALAEDSQAKHD
jgi:hypothetical protein